MVTLQPNFGDSKFSPRPTSFSGHKTEVCRMFLRTTAGLFRLEKLCVGQPGGAGANVLPVGENPSAFRVNFDAHAAIFRRMINFRATEAERVVHTGDGGFVA